MPLRTAGVLRTWLFAAVVTVAAGAAGPGRAAESAPGPSGAPEQRAAASPREDGHDTSRGDADGATPPRDGVRRDPDQDVIDHLDLLEDLELLQHLDLFDTGRTDAR